MSAKAGISVLNFVVACDFPKVVGSLNCPWIAVPFEVMAATFPLLTCCRKNGL